MNELLLVSRAGPSDLRVSLPSPGPHRIGRRPEQAVAIADDSAVSRDHAELVFRIGTLAEGRKGGSWTVRDLGSRHGTRLNGLRIPSGREIPLAMGDMIGVGSTELRVTDPLAAPATNVSRTVDSGPETISSQPVAAAAGKLAQHRVGLLIELSRAMHGAESPEALASLLVDAAATGTGLGNAAVLGPPDQHGSVEVLAASGELASSGELRLSRSLLRRAAAGELAVTSGGSSLASGPASIIDLGIAEAVGAPITVGESVVAILYADRRSGGRQSQTSTDAAEFLAALAQFGGVALAGLRRIEQERRLRDLESDLAMAAAAHQFLLRDLDQTVGGVRVRGRSRAGRLVGGDFFRLAVREDRRLRIVLGDVAGKGVGAGVLMSALHGLLRAELDRCEHPEAIAMALGAFVDEHRHGNTFATAWIGEIDLERGEMRYVDAGHGYAAREREGAIEWLNAGGGPPYGAVPGFPYAAATADWKSGDRLLIVSDGFIEQPSASGDGDFGRQRMADWLASRDQRSLDGLFAKILDFAGGDQLADDATAVIVEA